MLKVSVFLVLFDILIIEDKNLLADAIITFAFELMPVSDNVNFIRVSVRSLAQKVSGMAFEVDLISGETVFCELQELASKTAQNIFRL